MQKLKRRKIILIETTDEEGNVMLTSENVTGLVLGGHKDIKAIYSEIPRVVDMLSSLNNIDLSVDI